MKNRIATVKHQIETQQAILDDASRAREHRAATLEIERLTKVLQAAERDQSAYDARERKRKADEAAKSDAHRADAEKALRDDLRMRFFAGNPAATEDDFERLYPGLRDAELVRRSEDARERARSRYRNLL